MSKADNLTEKLDEAVKKISRNVLKGLSYLHSTNWAHRDLKPDNICFSLLKGAMICDFTTIKQIDPDKKYNENEGTPAFQSPEMNDLMNEDGHLPQKADIWSLGITLFSFCAEKLPFYSKEEFELFSKC